MTRRTVQGTLSALINFFQFSPCRLNQTAAIGRAAKGLDTRCTWCVTCYVPHLLLYFFACDALLRIDYGSLLVLLLLSRTAEDGQLVRCGCCSYYCYYYYYLCLPRSSDSQAKLSQAKPSQARPSQAMPGPAAAWAALGPAAVVGPGGPPPALRSTIGAKWRW